MPDTVWNFIQQMSVLIQSVKLSLQKCNFLAHCGESLHHLTISSVYIMKRALVTKGRLNKINQKEGALERQVEKRYIR